MLGPLLSLLMAATPPPPPPPPVVVAVDGAFAVGAPATVALEHDGRVDSGALVSEAGLVITTAHAFPHPATPLAAALQDGRRFYARILALDPARDLALVRLEGPGPFPLVALAPAPGEVNDPALVIFQPGALAWSAAQGTIVQRYAQHQGRVDPLRFILRMGTPVFGEGGPVLDVQGRLVGIVAAPDPSVGAGFANVIGVDGIRLFLDRAGVYAPDFALAISSTPPGAQVTVDGRSVGVTSPAPLRVERLTMGRHEVKLVRPGSADDVVSVELLGRRTEVLNRTLDPGGLLTVAVNAPAQVWVDGSLRGTAPLKLLLPGGTHQLDLRAPGFLPLTQRIDVPSGGERDLDLTLERITAELSVNTLPAGALVTANGEPLGTTPLAHARVPAGTVEMGIHLAGHHSYRFNVTLAPREARDLGTYRLEAPFGWLDPKLPPGSQIALDDGPRHAPERNERLPQGEHQLKIYAPGYYAYRTPLSISDAQTVALDPPLALYDRLPTRKAVGYGLGGLGVAVGLVSIGLATDESTRQLAAPGVLVGLVAAGIGAYCLATSPSAEQGGWSEERSYQPRAETKGALP